MADRPTNSVDDSGVATTGKILFAERCHMKDSIINNQFRQTDLTGTCGKYGSLQCDGDAVIAIYNILQYVYDDITLKNVNDACIKRRAHFFGGMGWFKIWKLRRVFKTLNVRVKYKGRFKSFSQITEPYNFILVYWQKGENIRLKYRLKFQAARLVKDGRNNVWIEGYNPYHYYESPWRFKRFEQAFMPLLFVLE